LSSDSGSFGDVENNFNMQKLLPNHSSGHFFEQVLNAAHL